MGSDRLLLPYDVGQYHNEENSVLLSQVMQCADNIQQTLCRDVLAQRQGLEDRASQGPVFGLKRRDIEFVGCCLHIA